MRTLMKKVIESSGVGRSLLERYRTLRHERDLERLRKLSPEEIFTEYYVTNRWENPESRSGDGSTLEYTASLRNELAELLQRRNIRVLLDAPCGDFNWFRCVDRPTGMQYVGADIVSTMIEDNRSKYEDALTSFVHLDITKNPLPNADLWLCRDVLFHFSNDDIVSTLKNFVDSEIPLILTSSHSVETDNADIPTGSFRLLDLEKPPFSFPRPVDALEDFIEGFPARRLCLWRKDSLVEDRLHRKTAAELK